MLHEMAQQIIRLPLPQQRHLLPASAMEDAEEMDIWTAASLNSENIQEYNFEDEVNAKNSSNWTPLMYASYLGHRELCQLLILKGARVEEANERNQTALMLAASCGAIDIVRILLDFSADLNRRDQFGRSSLHYAVKYYHVHVVQLLLEKGANPNLPDYNDSTPVLAACENGDEKILSCLLEFRGDPNLRNKQGQNAFDIVTDEKMLALLRCYRQEAVEPALLEAIRQLDLQKYMKHFSDRGIKTHDALLRLGEKDLEEMGIDRLGPKRKLTNYIREAREKRDNSGSNCARKISNPTLLTVPAPQTVQCQQQQQIQPVQTPPVQQQQITQQRLDELTKLVADQKREMTEQKQLNAQCRHALTQILMNGRCTACVERAPRRGSIEELIRELDRMNARIGSFLL